MKSWVLLLIFAHLCAASKEVVEMDLFIGNECNDAAGPADNSANKLRLKGYRLVFYKNDGKENIGDLRFIRGSIPVMLADKIYYIGDGAQTSVIIDFNKEISRDVIDVIKKNGLGEFRVQLYIYVDDPTGKSPLNFGAPGSLFQGVRTTDDIENPYYITPARYSRVRVKLGGVELFDKGVDRENCFETTMDWIVRPGIYRFAECKDSDKTNHVCEGHKWLNTYFDPYDGYVSNQEEF